MIADRLLTHLPFLVLLFLDFLKNYAQEHVELEGGGKVVLINLCYMYIHIESLLVVILSIFRRIKTFSEKDVEEDAHCGFFEGYRNTIYTILALACFHFYPKGNHNYMYAYLRGIYRYDWHYRLHALGMRKSMARITAWDSILLKHARQWNPLDLKNMVDCIVILHNMSTMITGHIHGLEQYNLYWQLTYCSKELIFMK
ncbi:hypothetical protein ACJX0J_013357, partial [Zea mays]